METEPLIGDKLHVHTTSWIASSSIIVANMLGAGVLGLPNAIKGMGIGPGWIYFACLRLQFSNCINDRDNWIEVHFIFISNVMVQYLWWLVAWVGARHATHSHICGLGQPLCFED